MDNLFLAGKTPFLFGDMLVNFGDILPETAKAVHAGMGWNSHLTWLSNDSLYMPYCIELELGWKRILERGGGVLDVCAVLKCCTFTQMAMCNGHYSLLGFGRPLICTHGTN